MPLVSFRDHDPVLDRLDVADLNGSYSDEVSILTVDTLLRQLDPGDPQPAAAAAPPRGGGVVVITGQPSQLTPKSPSPEALTPPRPSLPGHRRGVGGGGRPYLGGRRYSASSDSAPAAAAFATAHGRLRRHHSLAHQRSPPSAYHRRKTEPSGDEDEASACGPLRRWDRRGTEPIPPTAGLPLQSVKERSGEIPSDCDPSVSSAVLSYLAEELGPAPSPAPPQSPSPRPPPPEEEELKALRAELLLSRAEAGRLGEQARALRERRSALEARLEEGRKEGDALRGRVEELERRLGIRGADGGEEEEKEKEEEEGRDRGGGDAAAAAGSGIAAGSDPGSDREEGADTPAGQTEESDRDRVGRGRCQRGIASGWMGSLTDELEDSGYQAQRSSWHMLSGTNWRTKGRALSLSQSVSDGADSSDAGRENGMEGVSIKDRLGFSSVLEGLKEEQTRCNVSVA